MMKIVKLVLVSASLLPLELLAMGEDDPLITTFSLDQLEQRITDGEDILVWDAGVSVGKDFNKLLLSSEGEYSDGETESHEIKALYSRAVSPYWDATLGLRHDKHPDPERNWVQLGLMGLAPGFIDTELELFIGEHGRSELSLTLEKELMITQKWVLSPELEAVFNGHNDEATGAGSGFSSLELGLRLRYEIRREFAPYVGINWEKTFGNTADFSRAEGEDVSDTQWVVGFTAWY